MKRVLFYFLPFLLISCSLSKLGHDKSVTVRLTGNRNTIVIESDTITSNKYVLTLGDIVLDSGYCSGVKNLEIPKILGKCVDKKKEIALLCAKNDYFYSMNLKVGDDVDTTFQFQQTVNNISSANISFTGFGTPLIKKTAMTDVDKELKIWLYRKKEHLGDSIFAKFVEIYKAITRTGYNDYVPNGEIPVVHDVAGLSYKINSDIKADYYAVVACEYQKYIDRYIEELVANDFKGVSTTLSVPLQCHYRKGASGYRTVFLVCINKDWSYKLYPLAVFAMDNSFPKCLHPLIPYGLSGNTNIYDYPQEPASLLYKDKIRVLFPDNSPRIYGGACVCVVDWDGNGLECNVTFKIEFAGDCKSVTIHRRGSLCYYQPYIGYHFKPEDKVIYDKYIGPYTFTYKMHFESGNNIIPFTLEDYHGNKNDGEITIKARFVRDNSPSVNIENNNSIYN